MRKSVFIFTIVFIVAMLMCFSVAPVAIAHAIDGDSIITEGENVQINTPTMADRFKEWWADFANKELTVFGISFTVQAVLFFVVGIIAKKIKNRISNNQRETKVYLDKVRDEYSTVMSELERARATYLKIEKNSKIDEIIQKLENKTETVETADVSAEVSDEPAEEEPSEEESSEEPSATVVSRPIV